MRSHSQGNLDIHSDLNVHCVTGSLSGHISSGSMYELVSDDDMESRCSVGMLQGGVGALEAADSHPIPQTKDSSEEPTSINPDQTPTNVSQASLKSYTTVLQNPVTTKPDALVNHCSSLETNLTSTLQKTKRYPPIHISNLQAYMQISKCYGNIPCSVAQEDIVSPPLTISHIQVFF